MSDTKERMLFECMLSQPPHAARMAEHAGHYVNRLGRDDREALLGDATERLWEMRRLIKKTKDVLTVWVSALDSASRRRPRWRVWFNVYESRWVEGSQLGRSV